MASKNGKAGDMLQDLQSIANLMEEKNLSLVKIETEGRVIKVERGTRAMAAPTAAVTTITAAAAAPTAPAAAPTPAAASGGGDLAGAIKSPVVGTVYLAPKPGEPQFVKVGDKVNQGAVLMIVEAMKVMNQITAPRAGTVTAILVGNEDPVEFGQPLAVLS